MPKFDQFLTKDTDGHWVAPSGYWKTLIDFKMYDNDGKGAPQKTVQPKFNMDEAKRVLSEYDGDPNSLPVAWDIVEKAVEKFGDSAGAYTPSKEGKSFPAAFEAANNEFKGKNFVVAHTSAAPAELNLPSAEVHLRGDKVTKIKKDHPAMSDEVIKRIPDVIENPVFALKSKTVPDRIVLVGDLMDDNGYPVVAVISTKAKKSDSVDVEFIPLHSVYGKDSDPQNFIDTSEFVYVSKDKNRVRNWEKTARLQLPSEVIPSDSDTSISASEKKVNGSFSLPAPSVIAQQANEYQLRQLNDYNGPTPGDGQRPRQFADQTAQDSPAMPDYVKQYLWNSYGEHFYDADTNRALVERGWQRISENGMEAKRDRLMNLERFSADDTAEANLLMAIAFGTGDVETALGLASRYNQEGTEIGQELQARKLFSKMNPMGAKIWVAGHAERKFKEWQQSHQPAVKRITAEANRVADIIRDMQGGEEHLHLTDGSDLTIDSSNNKWGIPLNEQQLALIDHYHLDNVARPGIHYNWATTRQRMLEAILCTPNPLELTGGGMNLVERLEYMKSGEAVVTNADLEYIGNQMATFVGAGGEAGGREANVAISRAYEAFGNITPATGREKFRTWRYTSM